MSNEDRSWPSYDEQTPPRYTQRPPFRRRPPTPPTENGPRFPEPIRVPVRPATNSAKRTT